MSSENIFNILTKFISECSTESPDEMTPLIELNTRRGSNAFYKSDDFNNAYINYILRKFRKNDMLTDPNNQWQVQNAMNVIYLDGDWHFTEQTDEDLYSELSTSLANEYTNAWLEQLSDYEVNFKLIFIPSQFPKAKGGFHSFIYLNSELTVDQRKDIYENVKRTFIDRLENEYIEYIINEYSTIDVLYSKLFDTGPLITMQCLLPFAQKSRESRRYKLIDYEGFDIDNPPTEIIKPVIPNKSSHFRTDDCSDLKSNVDHLIADADNVDPLIEQLIKESEEIRRKRINYLGKVGRLTAEFITNLIYLSDDHILWKQIADEKIRVRFIDAAIKFIYANYIIEHSGDKPNESEFKLSLATALLPLMRRSLTSLNEDAKRIKWKTLMDKVTWYYMRVEGDKNTEPIFDNEMLEFWHLYVQMSIKDKKKLTPDQCKLFDKIKRRFQEIVSNWTKYITEVIMNGLRDEIRPFKEVDKNKFDPAKFNARDGVTFDQVIPIQPNVSKTVVNVEESFYVKTIRSWTLMFMFVEYYNSNSITETIRSIISAFVRYYIWVQKEMNGSNTIYIYNIHQTQMLTAYPYNQWIVDNDGENLRGWIKTIYLQFIKKELQTINKCRRLMPFLSNLALAGIPISDMIGVNVKPLPNFDSDMDRVYKNILSAFTQERYAPPKELGITTSSFLPMRNGLLEFDNKGEVIFHTDNHDRFMNAYTNITWDPNYDPKAPENETAYKAVSLMLEQIFPVADEREYAMYMYASTLHGKGLRDMFIIQYGTGGDGKTTMNNLVNSMLGTDGLSEAIQTIENGKTVYIKNPRGLATSMKTSTILSSKSDGHDEGGIIQLKDKRFCSMQEPDSKLSGGKLNCSRIKDIISGTQVTGRRIYKGAEAFVPNCLMTLQTNFVPGYDEDNDAIRRRIVVMPFRSKFFTKTNSSRMKNLQFAFAASSELNHELTTNPKYWQAFFYILLPYAQRLISKGFLPLANIKQPRSIELATNDSFSRSNGIVGWFNKNMFKVEGCAIKVCDIVQRIIDEHANTFKINGGLLTTKGLHAQRNEVYQQLGATYMGSVYRFKDKFYNDDKTDVSYEYQSLQLDIVDSGLTNHELVDKYFDGHAIPNMEYSQTLDKSDLYIVGIYMKKDDKDTTPMLINNPISSLKELVSEKHLSNNVSEGHLSSTQTESKFFMD